MRTPNILLTKLFLDWSRAVRLRVDTPSSDYDDDDDDEEEEEEESQEQEIGDIESIVVATIYQSI